MDFMRNYIIASLSLWHSLEWRICMKVGIVFDMDGTLWDSTEQVLISWKSVLDEYGVSLSLEKLKSLMGKTMDVIGESIMPDVPKKERDEIFERCYQAENEYLRQHGGILYPELEQTLSKLKEKYRLYIVSNCQSGYIEAFLEHHKLGQYFEDFECFGNTGKEKSENQKLLAERNHLERVIYVGDIQGDYEATMEAGFEFVYASYGFGTVDADVEKVDTFSQLPLVLEEMIKEQ